MLEAARDCSVVRFLYPSSLTVYGESLYDRAVAYEAVTPPVPESLYGIAKYAAERMVIRFGQLWGLDVVCGRIGSVFGPWEVDSGVRDTLSPFWQVLQAASAGHHLLLPAEMPGRELTYSRDLADALVCLLFAERHPHAVYNLASPGDWDGALAQWCGLVAARRPGFTWSAAGPGETPTVRWQDPRPRARQCTERLRQLGFGSRFAPASALADYASWAADNPGSVEGRLGLIKRREASGRKGSRLGGIGSAGVTRERSKSYRQPK
ncbi:MAG: hypothetical protein NVS3B2_02390 [Ramlibacter sp.]